MLHRQKPQLRFRHPHLLSACNGGTAATQPVEVKPVEVKPVEARPIDVTPVEKPAPAAAEAEARGIKACGGSKRRLCGAIAGAGGWASAQKAWAGLQGIPP